MARHGKHRKPKRSFGATIAFFAAATLLVVVLAHDVLVAPVKG